MIKKTLRLTKEFIKWALHGCPIRNKLEIKQRFDICQACPFFDRYAPNTNYGTCEICGCNIHETDQGLNKLAWGTTKCPDSPPRWQ